MHQQRAFTLVELSIVLVILGLLIGGVLTGQSLIRASELRSVATQHARYATAVHTFRDKYMAIPGDMPNAQSYWGVVHATPATCITTASTTTATCNGDGNGMLDLSTGSAETYRFWQHLANAGLIEGSYTGISGSGNGYTSIPANVPIGKLSGSLWHAGGLSDYSGAVGAFDGVYGNQFVFGLQKSNYVPIDSIMKAEEAYNIDTKLDDGKPATGKIVPRTSVAAGAWLTQTCTDATASNQFNANYLLSSNTVGCALSFRNQF